MATAEQHMAEIERINTDLATQSDLIAQIQTALEGKAGGSGGGVDTCTVTLSLQDDHVFDAITVITFTNGMFSEYIFNYVNDSFSSITIENVVCGTCMHIVCAIGQKGYTFTGGCSLIGAQSANIYVRAPSENGAIGTAYIYDND